MTTITLEVPDELAAQFKINPANVSALIREAVTEKLALPSGNDASVKPVHEQIIDFLASSPPLEQMIDFKISEAAQERLEDLLDRNREGELTLEEEAELDKYFQYRHVMILLKASARRAVNSRPEQPSV